MQKKAILKRLSAPPVGQFIDYTSEGGGSKMLGVTGIERVSEALALGYDTKDLGKILKISSAAILASFRALDKEDSVIINKAMIQGCERIIEEVTQIIKEEIAAQYEGFEDDDIILQGQKALLAEKRIKNLEAMIKVYERKASRIEARLFRETDKTEAVKIEHNIIVSENFINIIPE